MQIEDYFDFQAPDDIRVRGSRIGIETVLYDYLCRHRTAEEIQLAYPTLTLEQVYATILFYLHEPGRLGDYFAGWVEYADRSRMEAREHPDPAWLRIRALQAEIKRYPVEERNDTRRRIAERERVRRSRQKAERLVATA